MFFFLAVFGIWRSNFSPGLSLLQYLYVSRLSGLPYSCRTGWRILMNFHSEARRSVVRILLSSPHQRVTMMSLETNLLFIYSLCRTQVDERAIHNALEKRQVELEAIRCDFISLSLLDSTLS